MTASPFHPCISGLALLTDSTSKSHWQREAVPPAHSPELTPTHLGSGAGPFLRGLLPSRRARSPRGALGLRLALGGCPGRGQPGTARDCSLGTGTGSLPCWQPLLAAAPGLGTCCGCWQPARGTAAPFHIIPGCSSVLRGCASPRLVPRGCGTGSWGSPPGCAALLCRAQPLCFQAASLLPQACQIPAASRCVSTGISTSISTWACSLTAGGLDFWRSNTCVRQLCGLSWCCALRRQRVLFPRDGLLCFSLLPFLLKKKKNKDHNVCLFIAKGKLFVTSSIAASADIFLQHRAKRE